MTIPRPTHARVEPIPELAAKLRQRSKTANVNATMARHDKLGKALAALYDVVLRQCDTPRRDRELIILRTGWNCQAVYEFGQHTLMGKEAGLTDAEVYAVTRPPTAYAWSDKDRLLLQMTDELCGDNCVSDATWAGLTARWSVEEIMELVTACLSYRVVSGLLNTFGVQLDDGVPGWPTPAP